MAKSLLIALASHATTLVPADAGDGERWVQLCPAGKFTSSRDERGPWDAGGRADMEAIVRRSLSIAGRTDLVVDYDHQSVYGAVPGVGGTAPAAGWIKEMQVRDAGIWGRVEWTASAAAAIKAGEYRYLSPVLMHLKATGKVLAIRMAALTNTPALDLDEVAASALLTNELSEGDPMDKLIAALGLAAGSGEDTVLSAVKALLTSSTAIARAAGLTETAKPAEILTAVTAACSDRKAFAEAAGLNGDAATAEVVTALKAAVTAGNPDPTKFVPIAQVTALQADFKALQDSLGADKATAAVEKAIEDGKLAPSLKEWGLDAAKADLKKFEAFAAASPKLTAPQLQAGKVKTSGPGLSETDMAVCSAMGIDPAKFAETAKAYEETV
ncbi:MAG: phage protease [Pseudomonadota bacterium]